jgi:hypothetical protein
MNNTTNTTITTLHDRITRIAEAAEGYAKEVTEDYIGDWERTLAAKMHAETLAEEAGRTAGAFAHAAAWLELADKLREAAGDGTNKGENEIAEDVASAIHEASGHSDIADWGCVTSIAKELKEAAEEAIREADADDCHHATIAKNLTNAWVEAACWG